MNPTHANIIIPSSLPEGALNFIQEMAQSLTSTLKMVTEPVEEPVIVIPIAGNQVDKLDDVMSLLLTMNILFNIRIFAEDSLFGVWVWRHSLPAPLYLSPAEIASDEMFISLDRLPSVESTMQGVALASIAHSAKRAGDIPIH